VKFRCDRDALSEALQTVQRGVSSRPGIPALTGVLIEAGSDGTLTLTTTDLEVSARLSLGVQVTEDGMALIPARLIADTVKSLSDAPVDVEADQSQARIRCAAYEGALRLLPAEDFPSLQPPTGTRVVADSPTFAEAVAQVARAASRDEARPVLTGVLLEVSREGVTLVATDSYRLAVRELIATAAGEGRAIVPERAMSEAGRAAATVEKGEIEIFLDDSQVSFQVGQLTLTSRLIEGEFPNYRQVIPNDTQHQLALPAEPLQHALRRVALLSAERSRAIKFELAEGKLSLSSNNPDLGEAREELDVDYAGPPLAIAFNARYLIDAVGACGAKEVRISLRDPLSPALLAPTDDEDSLAVVMPMRL
jgi:DNA polymerase III subunit beta